MPVTRKTLLTIVLLGAGALTLGACAEPYGYDPQAHPNTTARYLHDNGQPNYYADPRYDPRYDPNYNRRPRYAPRPYYPAY